MGGSMKSGPIKGRVLQFEPGLDDPGSYCCEEMKYQMVGTADCRDPKGHSTGTVQCPKQVITFDAKITEYCISPVGLYSYQIRFCPFCGAKLTESQR